MKKIVLLTAALIMTASMVYAKGNSLIAGTKHNLSSGSTAITHSTNQDQICIFCHTPHNAIQNVPLWNRKNDLSTFRLYTSSPTLTNATKASVLTAANISIFCMNCHDGAAGLGANINMYAPNTTVTTGNAPADFLTGSAKLGTVLTNSHPVGFDYVAAQSQDTTGGLRLVSASGPGIAMPKIQFFKAGAVAKNVECASCHEVHSNLEVPFLRTTRTGSILCLACHIK